MWVQKTVMDIAGHVGAAWSAPNEAPGDAQGHQFNPWAVTEEEEEVTALISEVGESCSNMGSSSRSSGDGAWLLPQQHGGMGGPLCGICMAVVHIPWLRQASPYAQIPLLQQEGTNTRPCPAFCCGDSFFYCSTAPKTVVFEADCVFVVSVGQDCPSGLVQRMKKRNVMYRFF